MVQTRSERWPGVLVVAVWIAAIVLGGLLDQQGQHRASRFLAGAAAASVGVAFLVDWRGVSREASAYNARWWSRWPLFSMGWQRSERWQFILLRAFAAFALVVGGALFISGFAY